MTPVGGISLISHFNLYALLLWILAKTEQNKRDMNIKDESFAVADGCVRVRRCELGPRPQLAGRRGPKWAVERMAWRCLSPLGPSVCEECDPREGERADERVSHTVRERCCPLEHERHNEWQQKLTPVHIAVLPDDVLL